MTGSGYASRFAEDYDTWFGLNPHTADTVNLLAQLAGAEPVLELGIGTGRVALPLRARGIDVHGIDSSPEMVARLRSKPGGEHIPVTIGDFSEIPAEGCFSVIYLAAGSFFELPGQDDQLRCFRNAATRLAPGGVFVFDALLPEAICAPESGGKVVPADGERLVLRYRNADRATQRYDSHYVIVDAAGTRHLRVRFRYAGHGELDLMAQIAGLRLRERWGSWATAPLGPASTFHVSVYEIAD